VVNTNGAWVEDIQAEVRNKTIDPETERERLHNNGIRRGIDKTEVGVATKWFYSTGDGFVVKPVLGRKFSEPASVQRGGLRGGGRGIGGMHALGGARQNDEGGPGGGNRRAGIQWESGIQGIGF